MILQLKFRTWEVRKIFFTRFALKLRQKFRQKIGHNLCHTSNILFQICEIFVYFMHIIILKDFVGRFERCEISRLIIYTPSTNITTPSTIFRIFKKQHWCYFSTRSCYWSALEPFISPGLKTAPVRSSLKWSSWNGTDTLRQWFKARSYYEGGFGTL